MKYDGRAPAADILWNDRGGSFTVFVDLDTLGDVGEVADWSVAIVKGDASTTSLITPTISVSGEGGNWATFTWTDADAETLIDGSAFLGRYTFTHDDGAQVYEVKGDFTLERAGTIDGSTNEVTLTKVDQTVTITAAAVSTAAISTRIPFSEFTEAGSLLVGSGAGALTELAAGDAGRSLVSRGDGTLGYGYQSAKGPDVIVIGTSIELGSGGDVAYNGVSGSLYLDGYPSNASYMLHACASSGGRLRMKRNAGIGGDTLGGIGHVIAPAAVGATTLDVAVDVGPRTPYAGQTIFFDWGFSAGSLGAGQDANYVTAVTNITGGVRLTLLAPTAVAHAVGDVYRHGIIGRFQYDVARFGADIVVLGGPVNDGANLTVAQATAGMETLIGYVYDMDALPVVSTMLPSSAYPDFVEQGNAALKALCEDAGVWWFDAWRVMVNPATRFQSPTLSYDTVHPNQEGAMAIAQAFHEQVTDRMEIRLSPRRAVGTDGQAINCAPNGTFSSGSTGSGDTLAATGWTTYSFFGAGFTTGIVAPKLTDTINGNLLKIASGGAGTSVGGTWGQKATISLTASGTKPAWAVGDTIFLEAFVRLSGFKTDGNAVATICLAVTGTGGSVLVPLFYHWCRDFEGTITNMVSTIPSNVGTLTALELQAFMTVAPSWPNGTGLGTLEVGALTLFNLTAGDV